MQHLLANLLTNKRPLKRWRSSLRVWFTAAMLHDRSSSPRFCFGVVRWVGNPELSRHPVLSRHGGLTVRFRVSYDDGANHEHLLEDTMIEVLSNTPAGTSYASSAGRTRGGSASTSPPVRMNQSQQPDQKGGQMPAPAVSTKRKASADVGLAPCEACAGKHRAHTCERAVKRKKGKA